MSSAQPAPCSASTFRLDRHIPVDAPYDLVVAGGGPAGSAAAICAGRLGLRVLLVEGTGCLGGMGTSGLVTAFDPMSNGEEMLVGGLMREIVETLFARGGLGPEVTRETFSKAYRTWTPFNVEAYKLLLDELAVAAGVEIRFFTRLIDVDAEPANGLVRGVVLHNVEGYRHVPAHAFVDATGDAVLADLCRVPCREAGRDTPRIMPCTLASLFTGMDYKKHPHDWHAQYNALKKALEDGHFTQHDLCFPGMSAVARHIGYLNAGHMFNVNALRCRDLSDGVMLGRRLANEYLRFYRKYVPGFENIEHVTTASLVGVRESRRIVGEYELNVADFKARREFPDQIGLFNKFIDVHPYDTSREEIERFWTECNDPEWRIGPGERFGIPYGILVPRGWKNLWVAGRCVSTDVKVHGVIRVQPSASMMGQAAGTAAVLALRHGETADTLDTRRLVETLRGQGAYLPQPELRRDMTRASVTASA